MGRRGGAWAGGHRALSARLRGQGATLSALADLRPLLPAEVVQPLGCALWSQYLSLVVSAARASVYA